MSKVFISASSADLAEARRVAELGLKTINLETVEQTYFESDYGKMLDRLRRKLEGCDAIVHIAGLCYGAEPDPATLPADSPRRSYTQWEYHIANDIQQKRKNFRIYAFLTAENYPSPVALQARELEQLQREHRALIDPIKTATISSDDQLREKCKEIQLEVEKLKRSNRQVSVALAMVLIPIIVISLGLGLSRYACQAPGIHAICKYYGWGGVPTELQRQQFRDAAAAGCDGLRRYLRDPGPEVLRQRAQRAIDAREIIPHEVWRQQPEVVQSIQLDSVMATAMVDEASAKSASEDQLLAYAIAQCTNLLASGLYRMPANRELARLQDIQFDCKAEDGTVRCGTRGVFICQADVLSENFRDRCHVPP